MKKSFFLLLIFFAASASAQQPDHTYFPNIRSVKLFKAGDIYSYPILSLNGTEQLQLHFDDLDADVKNYYYSFQLCNADWTPANIQPFDYTRGFQSNRITNYRNSSIVFTRYTHYQAIVPERNSIPTRSGNYLLKVFLNDDMSKLVFTKRFLVVDNKTTVAAQVMQPFNGNLFRTHQRVQIAVNTANSKLNIFSPQDLKVSIVQNYNWQGALLIDRPTIFRGNYFEYMDEENTTFPSGREWRWVDLRNLRLISDRVQRVTGDNKQTDIYVKPDGDRSQQIYIYYPDINGMYTVENTDGNNPYWQSDYAWTHFTFIPPGNRPLAGRDVYVFGELTNYTPGDSSRMVFNEEKGVYEKALFLKQGYYNYSYVTLPDKKPATGTRVSMENTEGNFWSTENAYMVLVYFRPFGARADELIGFTRLNSVIQR